MRSHRLGRRAVQAGRFAAFKLLYDIYHMQIMEGDIIRTIRENSQYIGSLPHGGNPGRNEIDETQELNYPADRAGDRRSWIPGLHVARVLAARGRTL